MNDSMDDTPEIRTAGMPVLGRQLAEAREAQGLSVEDVSSRLRLSTRQIKALEEDDFTLLPDPMITRGFIRNYARLLELDPEPLLEAYRAQVPSEPPRAITIPSANIPISDANRRPRLLYLLGGLLIVVLLGLWLYAEKQTVTMTPSSSTVPIIGAPEEPATNAPEASMPVPALPLAERLAEESISNPVEEPVAPAIEQPAQSAASTEAEESIADTTTAVANSATIEMDFSNTSWVSVIDGNNQEILNMTKPAGSREVVQGKPPFKVVIGNASGSEVTYNGKTVDLGPHTRLNVARITLE